jgi:hypothetical protein
MVSGRLDLRLAIYASQHCPCEFVMLHDDYPIRLCTDSEFLDLKS